MGVLKLDESLLLGQGNERFCYAHPDDPSKVVKVAYKDEKSRNQNLIEYLYSTYLERKNVDFSHITRCYGWVETNRGRGLLFDRVENFDGSGVVSLHELLQKRFLEREVTDGLMEELRVYLEKNGIIFADVSLTNVMCRMHAPGRYTLVIVDGLGSRRLGWKFWLYRHAPWYVTYKIGIQWAKVMRNYLAYFKSDS